MSNNFDEKSGVINCKTDWGLWYQTTEEVIIEINAPLNTKGKDVSVLITPSKVSCKIHGDMIITGTLLNSIIPDESTWTVEDRKLVRILLTKSLKLGSKCWESLLIDGGYKADLWTFEQMQKKFALEKYQTQHPGFDFSSAEISGDFVDGGTIQ